MRKTATAVVLFFVASALVVIERPRAVAAAVVPVSVRGRIVDQSGRPARATATLWAWPDTTRLGVGDRVPMIPIGTALAAADGRFAVPGTVTPALLETAGMHGGFVNLTLRAVGDDTTGEAHFSRYVGPGGAGVVEGGARPWPARPEEDAAEVTVRLTEPGRVAPAAEGIPEMCPNVTELAETYPRQKTLLGELNTPDDTATAHFHYGSRADTDVSVATRVNGGKWSLSGEHHVGNSDQGTIGPEGIGSRQHLLLFTTFDYGRFVNYYTCGQGPKREYIKALEWRGDSLEEAGFPATCRPGSRYASNYSPGHRFERHSHRAKTWSGAASVAGVSLTARSGYSEHVDILIIMGRERADHWLCGDNSYPMTSERVMAGIPGNPGTACRPGRPC